MGWVLGFACLGLLAIMAFAGTWLLRGRGLGGLIPWGKSPATVSSNKGESPRG